MADNQTQGGGALTADSGGGTNTYAPVQSVLGAGGISPLMMYDPGMYGASQPMDQASADQSSANTQGILSQFGDLRQQRDQQGQQKMLAMSRAMAYLDRMKAGQTVNLPLLAAAGGMGEGWNLGAGITNAIKAATPVLEAQRQRDLGFAQTMGNMDVARAQEPIDINKMDEDSLEKQFRTQEYADMANARRYIADANANSRLGVAGINAGSRENVAQIQAQNRSLVAALNASSKDVKYSQGSQTDEYGNQVPGIIRTAPNEPPQFIPNLQFTGANGAGGRPSVFQQKQQAWLATHPGDYNGSLDYAGGHREMSDQEIMKSALQMAHSEFPPPKDVQAEAQNIFQQIKGAAPSATAQPSQAPAAAPAKPPAPLPERPLGGNYGGYSGIKAPAAQPTNAAPQQSGKLKPPDASTLEAARNAIQRGADPKAVAQRLQDNGFDPSGL